MIRSICSISIGNILIYYRVVDDTLSFQLQDNRIRLALTCFRKLTVRQISLGNETSQKINESALQKLSSVKKVAVLVVTKTSLYDSAISRISSALRRGVCLRLRFVGYCYR